MAGFATHHGHCRKTSHSPWTASKPRKKNRQWDDTDTDICSNDAMANDENQAPGPTTNDSVEVNMLMESFRGLRVFRKATGVKGAANRSRGTAASAPFNVAQSIANNATSTAAGVSHLGAASSCPATAFEALRPLSDNTPLDAASMQCTMLLNSDANFSTCGMAPRTATNDSNQHMSQPPAVQLALSCELPKGAPQTLAYLHALSADKTQEHGHVSMHQRAAALPASMPTNGPLNIFPSGEMHHELHGHVLNTCNSEAMARDASVVEGGLDEDQGMMPDLASMGQETGLWEADEDDFQIMSKPLWAPSPDHDRHAPRTVAFDTPGGHARGMPSVGTPRVSWRGVGTPASSRHTSYNGYRRSTSGGGYAPTSMVPQAARRAPTPAGHLLGRPFQDEDDDDQELGMGTGGGHHQSGNSGSESPGGMVPPCSVEKPGGKVQHAPSKPSHSNSLLKAVAKALSRFSNGGTPCTPANNCTPNHYGPSPSRTGSAARLSLLAGATPGRAYYDSRTAREKAQRRQQEDEEALANLMCDECDFCTPPHSPHGAALPCWTHGSGRKSDLRRTHSADEAMFGRELSANGADAQDDMAQPGAQQQYACMLDQAHQAAPWGGLQENSGGCAVHWGGVARVSKDGFVKQPSTDTMDGSAAMHTGSLAGSLPNSGCHALGLMSDLDTMEQDGSDYVGGLDDSMPVAPCALNTLQEFNAQLSMAAERGDRARAERLWAEIRCRNIAPDIRTLNMLMRCMRKSVIHPDEAEELMCEVCDLGNFKPNAMTYNLLAEIRCRCEQLGAH